MPFLVVHVIVGSRDEARTIARQVVEERLAACANLLGPVESTYWWKGAVESAEEVILLLKTRASLFDRLSERIRGLHSYECPCIVAYPITLGTPDFLAWIETETSSGASTTAIS